MTSTSGSNITLPQGSLVALVTPFTDDGKIDKAALRNLVEFHIDSGTNGIVVAGTTGECSTLTHKEHETLIALALEYSEGRVHVMAGVGSNSTSEAVRLTQFANSAGAHSVLSVVPYYNKPSQEGLYRHFSSQADASDIPVILYNVPSRTITDLNLVTTVRLANHPNIAGIKDATGDMAAAKRLFEALPDRFAFYSGDDFTSFDYMQLGGHGVISVVANVYPRVIADMCFLIRSGFHKSASQIHKSLTALTEALFKETSPGPVKYATSLLGYGSSTLRLPLLEPEDELKRALEQLVKNSDLE